MVTHQMSNYSYSVFLFANLATLHRPLLFPTKDVPYDVQYDKFTEYYAKFVDSDYNSPTISEYECMENYLHSLPLGPERLYSYNLPYSNVNISFDYGIVIANSTEDALCKAIEELQYNFKKANDAFNHCDITLGFEIGFSASDVTVQLIKE